MNRRIRSRILLTMVVAASLATDRAGAEVTASGSYWPVPLHSGDGVVQNELQLGLVFNSNGTVIVTNGDTLRTKDRVIFGYTVAATGTANVTNANWVAESSVFMGHVFRTEATADLDNSIWTVESNVQMAQGDMSTAGVTLDNGSTWTTEFGVVMGSGEDAAAYVHLVDGTWTSPARIQVGGSNFFGREGDGTVNLHTSGVMDCQYMLEVTSNGYVHLDGGELRLAGETHLSGVLDASSNGGRIVIHAGAMAGGPGIVYVGVNADFTHCDLELVFHPTVTPNVGTVYDMFDPIDGVDLKAKLDAADAITAPPGWWLDRITGELRFVPVGVCVLGPEMMASGMCQEVYDADGDGDVDLVDFGVFQVRYAGWGW